MITIFYFVLSQRYNHAQTVGGNSVYNFLKLSNTPQLTALGGINISNQTDDAGMVFSNPALIRPEMHTQANFVFNSLYGNIKNYNVLMAYHEQKIKTNFAAGINFINYGEIVETDPAGNIFGDFKPRDYVFQLSASRRYENSWYYGTAIKFIYSQYGQYRSSGIALDVGVSFSDSIHFIQAGLVIKNMGLQIKSYNGTASDDLPFDIQVGISKRLAGAPIQFSLTAHHLHQFDIRYNDTVFNNEYFPDGNSKQNKFTFDKLFRHLIFATQIFVGDKVEMTVGYNYLRRKELNIGNGGNGLNGFSAGLGLLFRNLQLRYGRSYYQNNTAYNQLGLSLKLKEYFALVKSGSNKKVNYLIQ